MAKLDRRRKAIVPAEIQRKRPSFSQIIHASIVQDGLMVLPKKYARELGEELSDVAALKVPTSKIWDIGLRKDDGRIWFENGLQEFIKFYSIHIGHFLTFSYDGNSLFNVLVFDMSGAEINYSSSSENGKPNIEGNQRTEKSVGDSPRKEDFSMAVPESSGTVSTPEERVAQVAMAFKSKKPFFRVVMRPAYVSGKYVLNVPFKFMQKHFGEEDQIVTLTDPNGRSWPVHCYFYTKCSFYAKFYKGFGAFATENHLKDGDNCVFELIKRKGAAALKVTIFRVDKS